MEKFIDESLSTIDPPIWIRSHDDVVLCSSVCLNRNIRGVKFPHKASHEDRKKVGARILGKIHHSAISDNFKYTKFSDMPFELKGRVYERRITFHTVNLEEMDEETMILLVSNDETSSIVINGDDHIQVRVTLPGNCISKCMESAESVIKQISMDFSSKSPFGFLTSSPAIMGSGIQIEMMVHLPGIALNIDPEEWISSAKISGIIPEGFWGYGTLPIGNVFTLCSKNTHRKTAESSIVEFNKGVEKIIKTELKLREEMDRLEKKDVVMRAYGTLKYVQKIEFEEAMSGLSLIKFGIKEKIITQIDEETINKLSFYILPSHLKSITGCDQVTSDVIRANLIRKAFSIKERI